MIRRRTENGEAPRGRTDGNRRRHGVSGTDRAKALVWARSTATRHEDVDILQPSGRYGRSGLVILEAINAVELVTQIDAWPPSVDDAVPFAIARSRETPPGPGGVHNEQKATGAEPGDCGTARDSSHFAPVSRAGANGASC